MKKTITRGSRSVFYIWSVIWAPKLNSFGAKDARNTQPRNWNFFSSQNTNIWTLKRIELELIQDNQPFFGQGRKHNLSEITNIWFRKKYDFWNARVIQGTNQCYKLQQNCAFVKVTQRWYIRYVMTDLHDIFLKMRNMRQQIQYGQYLFLIIMFLCEIAGRR